MVRRARAPIAVFASLLLAMVARADVTIDTTPSWNGSSNAYPFAYPETATYGQTLTAPSAPDTVLASISFEIEARAVTYATGYVFAWDGSEATGSALFQSPEIVLTPSNPYSYASVTMDPGVSLAAGSQYVAFLTLSDHYAANETAGAYSIWGLTLGDTYGSGEFVFTNNGADESQWFAPWSAFASSDLAFTASFTAAPVPEPTGLALLGLGGLGATATRVVRRRRSSDRA